MSVVNAGKAYLNSTLICSISALIVSVGSNELIDTRLVT